MPTTTKVRRVLAKGQRAAIERAAKAQLGRKDGKLDPADLAERFTGGDIRIVRRVIQAAGIVEASPATRDRAKSLVAAWERRGAEDNGSSGKAKPKPSAKKATARKRS
jgi:hypothetical protein